jgi:hypothetical protein
MPRITSPAIATVLLAWATACQHNTISGELGRAEFEWSFCPASGCDNKPALARGAIAYLAETASVPDFDVSSTDASIVDFSLTQPDPTVIGVSAIGAGTAKLLLSNRANHELIDRLALTVKEPSEIAVAYPGPGWSVALMGGPIRIDFMLNDAAGAELISSGAIAYSPDPGIVVEPIDPNDSRAAVLVSTTNPGTSMVSLTSGQTNARLQISRVGPQEVARVAFVPSDSKGRTVSAEQTTEVSAGAFLGDGSAIYAPVLSWASEDPACVQVEEPPPLPMDSFDDESDRTELRAIRTGCTTRIIASAGSASAAIEVQTR